MADAATQLSLNQTQLQAALQVTAEPEPAVAAELPADHRHRLMRLFLQFRRPRAYMRRHGTPQARSPHRRRHVGRRGFLRHRRAAEARRATTWWASPCSFIPKTRRRRARAPAAPAQDIYDAKRVAETLGIPHYVLDYESRFRKARDRGFRRHLCPRRNADPLRALQSEGEVRRPAGHGARAGRRGAGHRPLCAAASKARTAPNCMPPPMPRATRAISCSPPPRRSSTICAFRWAAWKRREVRAIAAELGLVTADKPDSQDICFVPDGRYTAIVNRLRPDAARPGEIVDHGRRGAGPP